MSNRIAAILAVTPVAIALAIAAITLALGGRL